MAGSRIQKEVKLFKNNNIKKFELKFKKSIKNFDRFLFHEKNNDNIHIMLMFYKKNFNYPPHYSKNKSESFTVIKGKFRIEFYSRKGKLIKKILLDNKNYFSYKLNKNIYHKIIPISKICIALEILDGPFIKNSVVKANW